MFNKQFAKIIAIVLIMGAILGGMTSLPVSAKTPSSGEEIALQQGGGLIRTSAQDAVFVKARRPWTAAEMRAAKPYPMPDGEAQTMPTIDALAGPDGDAGAVAGKPPAAAKGLASRTSGDAADAAFEVFEAGIDFLGYSYPPPFSRQAVLTLTDYTQQWPFIAIGKLFFVQYGVSYVCSAAVVGNGYSSHGIMTAGHCLHAGDNRSAGWSTNVVFVPAYRNGNAPYEQWTASTLSVLDGWYTSANIARDVGAARLNNNGSGQTITAVVGYLGFAWNKGRNQHWWELGYPAASPFNGQFMIACQSSYAYDSPFGTTPKPVGVGCDMTGGSSGGPWVLNMGRNNYLNGVNSHRRNGYGKELFSPYFDSAVKGLWDWAITP